MAGYIKRSLLQHPLLLVAFAVAIAVYARFLSFGHISWDDPEMVFRNKAVRDFDLSALLRDHFVGNYIPVTMLMHALSWSLFGDHAGGHHAVNILLHLLNGVLVFRLGQALIRNKDVATLGAIVFLLHPVQIESVGWISELKTILSTTFYLWSALIYLRYCEQGVKTYWIAALGLFVLGCLSKSSTVVLPLSFFCFDLLRGRALSWKLLLEKIPFLLLSLVFGLINIRTQTVDLFINYSHAFPYLQRIGFAGYALTRYCLLFVLPINLSVIYPYPTLGVASMVTGYAFWMLLAGGLAWLYWKRNRVAMALLLFTLVNLVLVLQFIPFGEVLYADRYMYLPVVGLGWLAALLLTRLNPSLRVVSGACIVLLAMGALVRSQVWRSATSLYEDILRNFPNSFVALNSVGVEYMLNNNDDKALYYLNRSIQVSPGNYKGYYNRGLLFLKQHEARKALESFNAALSIYPYPKAFIGRGSAYHLLGDLPKAVADAQQVLANDPNNSKAHFILGNCYNDQNRLDEALQEYNTCLELNPDEADYFFKRAIVFGKRQDFVMCQADLNQCIAINPLHHEAYYWRGVAKVNLHGDPCGDLRVAAQANYQPAVNAYYRYCK